MKSTFSFIFTILLCNLLSCSGDKNDNIAPNPKIKQSVQEKIKTKPTISIPNSLKAKNSQPDLHLSGTQNSHISGVASTSEHISGQ
jgi:hypothetical protein